MKEKEKKRLFVVGNGPISRDMSGEVDAADFVVRFNEPKQSIGMSGTKTDWLFIANAGKPMQRRLEDPNYFTSPIVAAARRVFLVYHPDIIKTYHPKPHILSRLKGRRGNWTNSAILMYGRAGKEVTVMPPGFYEEGCKALGLSAAQMKYIFPSTGYFGIRYVLDEFQADAWSINLCGFSWEGWKRHAWGDERRWAERLAEEGRINVWL
ncbi:MAG: hypothetical protein BGN87_22880 [Rhizobiales bacterium 65-79]|jgi:hypothetical protein|nr:hypothetical protein [Hyphomicrobiales bacterium]OJU00167.1 MAG: hypothetical protein BGN87_22880 [Rhizobiales bacterium 65-79]